MPPSLTSELDFLPCPYFIVPCEWVRNTLRLAPILKFCFPDSAKSYVKVAIWDEVAIQYSATADGKDLDPMACMIDIPMGWFKEHRHSLSNTSKKDILAERRHYLTLMSDCVTGKQFTISPCGYGVDQRNFPATCIDMAASEPSGKAPEQYTEYMPPAELNSSDVIAICKALNKIEKAITSLVHEVAKIRQPPLKQ